MPSDSFCVPSATQAPASTAVPDAQAAQRRKDHLEYRIAAGARQQLVKLHVLAHADVHITGSTPRLYSLGRYRQDPGLQILVAPSCQPRLSGSRRRQDRVFQHQLRSCPFRRRPNLGQRACHLQMMKRSPVLPHSDAVLRQRLRYRLTGRIVGSDGRRRSTTAAPRRSDAVAAAPSLAGSRVCCRTSTHACRGATW